MNDEESPNDSIIGKSK